MERRSLDDASAPSLAPQLGTPRRRRPPSSTPTCCSLRHGALARQPPCGAASSGFPAAWMAAPPAVAVAHRAWSATLHAFRRRLLALRPAAMAGIPRVAVSPRPIWFTVRARGGRYFIYRPPLVSENRPFLTQRSRFSGDCPKRFKQVIPSRPLPTSIQAAARLGRRGSRVTADIEEVDVLI